MDAMMYSTLVNKVINFIEQCRIKRGEYAFASSPGGSETLYAACFACMLMHYLGCLDPLPEEEKRLWANYLNSWQQPSTGYFIGPELVPAELKSPKHTFEHVSLHQTAHVLPALSLLGEKPRYPLTFARPFTNLVYLQDWLNARDWRDAWLEGNNLLFVGQFLIHLRDVEGLACAQEALDLYFQWLEKEVDPATGLWGSNGYCSEAAALYGGYHQLLVFYYEDRDICFPKRLVKTALSLQHVDGGFHRAGGGGACEDVDALDILANLYKRVDYKRPHVRLSLRKALRHLLSMQMPDGGFVYRKNEPFVHMGIEKTASPANHSNLFSTWFRVNTLALIAEILTDDPVAQYPWQFNDCCSMGWHRPWQKERHPIRWVDRRAEGLVLLSQALEERIYARLNRIYLSSANRWRRFIKRR
jgi:hypothetical protein